MILNVIKFETNFVKPLVKCRQLKYISSRKCSYEQQTTMINQLNNYSTADPKHWPSISNSS